MLEHIYIYETVEVRLTGRKAHKIETAKPQRRAKTAQTPTKYEITPTETASWKKWVTMDELYEIDNSEVADILDDITAMESVIDNIKIDKDSD